MQWSRMEKSAWMVSVWGCSGAWLTYLWLYHDSEGCCGGLCADCGRTQGSGEVQKAILVGHAGQHRVAVPGLIRERTTQCCVREGGCWMSVTLLVDCAGDLPSSQSEIGTALPKIQSEAECVKD